MVQSFPGAALRSPRLRVSRPNFYCMDTVKTLSENSERKHPAPRHPHPHFLQSLEDGDENEDDSLRRIFQTRSN